MTTPIQTQTCSTCKGEGTLVIHGLTDRNITFKTPVVIECPDCHGTGEIIIRMTKKEFKNRASIHHYGKSYIAIFFDWLSEDYGRGFKYGVWVVKPSTTQKDLLNLMYDWIYNDVQLPWYVHYKIAQNDNERFKVPISSSILNNW